MKGISQKIKRTMMSKSRARGTAFESRVVSYLKEQGFPYASRLPLSGSKDVGDIGGVVSTVIECKNEKKIDLASYQDETLKEQANANAQVAFAVFPRRSRHIGKAYVLMTLDQVIELIK
jgi:Holliday junction resolvase